MALTDNLMTFNQAVFNLIDTNQVALGLADVWFGDQDRNPTTPCVAVEPGPKNREFNGVPRRFEVTMDSYVLVYIERIQDTQQNVKDMLNVSEAVEGVLHANAQLGGLVVHSFVMTNEPGYATRGGTLVRASRITFRGVSQVQLPYTP
jgi:hypothetical protein